ncbi:MAG: SWIM zinc finger family protein, partial [Candidatus Methanoperedens sp.]|nr:SWIM zinc finger family protein [Candidatus Methanoperedens sp.]
MRDETNNGITLKEAAIKRVYGETIFERGMDYFEDERVTNVIKLKNTLIGEVMGSAIYKTQVALDNLGCDCSCPYGTNCKHGVAVLLQYFNEEFNDGDEVMKRLDGMNREELRGVIDKLISMNPSNLMYLDVHSADDEKSHEIRVEALDKQIKSKLKRIEYSQADAGFVDDFARLIKVNEDVLTKEQIFEILEFLVNNCEEYGYFYDDYSDSYYGDEIFENLCDAFVKKQLEERDFEKLNDLSGRDDYDMLSSFFYRLSEVENPANLKDFEG